MIKSFLQYILEESESSTDEKVNCGWCGNQIPTSSTSPHYNLGKLCKTCNYMINAVGDESIQNVIDKRYMNGSPYHY